jgi:hypothetical protein
MVAVILCSFLIHPSTQTCRLERCEVDPMEGMTTEEVTELVKEIERLVCRVEDLESRVSKQEGQSRGWPAKSRT